MSHTVITDPSELSPSLDVVEAKVRNQQPITVMEYLAYVKL